MRQGICWLMQHLSAAETAWSADRSAAQMNSGISGKSDGQSDEWLGPLSMTESWLSSLVGTS